MVIVREKRQTCNSNFVNEFYPKSCTGALRNTKTALLSGLPCVLQESQMAVVC